MALTSAALGDEETGFHCGHLSVCVCLRGGVHGCLCPFHALEISSGSCTSYEFIKVNDFVSKKIHTDIRVI